MGGTSLNASGSKIICPVYGKSVTSDDNYAFPLKDWSEYIEGGSMYMDHVIPIKTKDKNGNPTTYQASAFELRCAVSCREAWNAYHTIKAYVESDEFGNTTWNPPFDPQVANVDAGSLSLMAAGSATANDMMHTSRLLAKKIAAGETVPTDQAFSDIAQYAAEQWMKKFAVPLPVEIGGMDNNVRFLVEEGQGGVDLPVKQESVWEIADSAFLNDFRLSGANVDFQFAMGDKFYDNFFWGNSDKDGDCGAFKQIFSGIDFYDSDGRARATALYTSTKTIDLSLIHISEPTRPY